MKNAVVLLLLLASAALVQAQIPPTVTVFATGAALGINSPDSIAIGNKSLWVAYTNGASSTGATGNSTVVQYDPSGLVVAQYTIAGSVDGLKVNPISGLVWALQNQDGNSTLTLIDPVKGITSGSPIPYAVQSTTRGYDEPVFRGNRVFLSYTNPTGPGDATIQVLSSSSSPIKVNTVLTMGATGLNLATGQTNQPTSQNDPDSLKLTPSGDLMLTSGDDGQFIFVKNPALLTQSVAFLNVLDPTTGTHVSGLDDEVFITAAKGTFYLADTKNNQVLAIDASGLPMWALYASVGSLNELVAVDMKTGNVTPYVSNLNGPHGLVFAPK